MKSFDYCYARPNKAKYFIKHKYFNNFNDILEYLRRQNCTLLSYGEQHGRLKATFRYIA